MVKEYIADRLKGMTYREIAQKHGVTPQAVQNSIKCLLRVGSQHVNIIYPQIRDWIYQNCRSIADFKRKTLKEASPTTMYRKLGGKADFTKSEIDIILSATDMTYEVAFATESKEEQPC